MKKQTTMKSITNNFNKVYRTGYCELQNIFKYVDADYYNAGVYGWNCDVYVDYGKNLAITTGYRNMRGEMIPTEIIDKYDLIAMKILSNTFNVPFDEIMLDLKENRENFLNELLNL